ncbi:glutamic-type intramembrane protease PrsW [Marinicrinis lubricantis]
MTFISLFSAASAPGIALLTYFYLKDKYVTEPLHIVLKLFLYGILLVFPIMVLQRGLMIWLGDNDIVFSFLISGGLEESLKWFILYVAIFTHSVFDEPYDGIVYAVSVSMGFATLENIIYAWAYNADMSMLLLRAFLPVSGHALFGVVMGYYLGKAKFVKEKKQRFLVYSVLFPVFWHGAFDWIVLNAEAVWSWFIVLFMLVLWLYGIRKVNLANAKSPFRTVLLEDEIEMRSKSQ